MYFDSGNKNFSLPLCNSTNFPTKLSADLPGVSLDQKKVWPRFLSLFGLLEAEIDLTGPLWGLARSNSAS